MGHTTKKQLLQSAPSVEHFQQAKKLLQHSKINKVKFIADNDISYSAILFPNDQIYLIPHGFYIHTNKGLEGIIRIKIAFALQQDETIKAFILKVIEQTKSAHKYSRHFIENEMLLNKEFGSAPHALYAERVKEKNGTITEIYYLVFEDLGLDIYELFQQNNLSPTAALDLGVRCLGTLYQDNFHENYVHRDLKLENLATRENRIGTAVFYDVKRIDYADTEKLNHSNGVFYPSSNKVTPFAGTPQFTTPYFEFMRHGSIGNIMFVSYNDFQKRECQDKIIKDKKPSLVLTRNDRNEYRLFGSSPNIEEIPLNRQTRTILIEEYAKKYELSDLFTKGKIKSKRLDASVFLNLIKDFFPPEFHESDYPIFYNLETDVYTLAINVDCILGERLVSLNGQPLEKAYTTLSEKEQTLYVKIAAIKDMILKNPTFSFWNPVPQLDRERLKASIDEITKLADEIRMQYMPSTHQQEKDQSPVAAFAFKGLMSPLTATTLPNPTPDNRAELIPRHSV